MTYNQSEDHYNNSNHENYIKHKDITNHRNKTIELLKSKEKILKYNLIHKIY